MTPSTSTSVPLLAMEGDTVHNLDLPRNLIILATPPSPSVPGPCDEESSSVQYGTVLYCPPEHHHGKDPNTSNTSYTITSTTTTTTPHTSINSEHTSITPGHGHRPPDVPKVQPM